METHQTTTNTNLSGFKITPCSIIHSISTQLIRNSVDGSAHNILVLIRISANYTNTYFKLLPGDLYVCRMFVCACVLACMQASIYVCIICMHLCKTFRMIVFGPVDELWYFAPLAFEPQSSINRLTALSAKMPMVMSTCLIEFCDSNASALDI